MLAMIYHQFDIISNLMKRHQIDGNKTAIIIKESNK